MSKTLELSLKQVEDSKVYVSVNENIKFKHPMDYIAPFMEELEPLNVEWSFTAEKGSENKNKEEDTETNIAYSRMSVKARLPQQYDMFANDPIFNKIYGEIGFVYSLEGGKPEMKVYRGNRVQVCTNMCIWGATNVLQLAMTDPKSSVNHIYDKTKRFVEEVSEEVNKAKRIIDKLSNEIYGEQIVNQKFGELIRLGIANPKLGINPVTGAIQAMLDPTSKYALETDKTITGWKFYNAVTEQIKKASILDEVTKTILLERMFNDN